MKSAWSFLAFVLFTVMLVPAYSDPSLAADSASSAAKSPAASGEVEQAAAKTEVYIGFYMQGSRPLNRAFRFQEDPFTNTDVQGGLGGGLKVGFFPAFAGRYIGLEAEVSGLDGKVNAPSATSGGVTRSANFRLQSINAMANLLLRYPGETIQPYVGIGAGLSGGFARDLNLQHSTIGVVRENAADGAFAYQLIGGVRANVTDRIFLFTEYKYLVANYQWESEFADGSHGPSFTLNYRAHILAGGLGVTF
ncbi:MAG: OMPb-brl domain-containing protein [Nitrospira sp.]|nr:outer membrane beta-barrel protein [Nitrospira sp.]ULA58819.1 MAG: OMPb-brl domain-containing protein [Nitrospira sp.]